MIEKSREVGLFTWVPLHERESRFGGKVPPRKADDRTPLFWLIGSGYDLYFVNLSGEVLTSITSSNGGFQTVDDDVVSTASNDVCYNDVVPNEAVKIDTFCPIGDSDFVIQNYISIDSPSLGRVELKGPPEKGGFAGDRVLRWKDVGDDSSPADS